MIRIAPRSRHDRSRSAGAAAPRPRVRRAAAQGAGRPSLGEIVRIGDLVENAGAAADVPMFRAPDLGQTGAVPVARVADARAALRHHRARYRRA